MSDVALMVGGRRYTMSCADGQEDHVWQLAAMVDAKLVAMGANLTSHEGKNLLFAAILLADELEEARRAPPPPPPPPAADAQRLAARLERVAGALENAAATLEGAASAG